MTDWRTSSYSGGTNPNCVECRTDGSVVRVRDSQHPEQGCLDFDVTEWLAFLAESERL